MNYNKLITYWISIIPNYGDKLYSAKYAIICPYTLFLSPELRSLKVYLYTKDLILLDYILVPERDSYLEITKLIIELNFDEL